MKKAIEIVDGFIKKIDDEISRNVESYRKTDATSVFDFEYRKLLAGLHETYMRKLTVLEEVKRALQEAYRNEDNE